MISLYRSKTPAERLEMAFAADRMVRLRLAGHFNTLHPDWTDEQIHAAIAERLVRGTTSEIISDLESQS